MFRHSALDVHVRPLRLGRTFLERSSPREALLPSTGRGPDGPSPTPGGVRARANRPVAAELVA
jgi:hypothetical protein